MNRSRMFGEDEPEQQTSDPDAEAMPSPRTTIVGGRPPEQGAEAPPVPTGIQRLLRMAAVDAAFLKELIERRTEVAEAAGVQLSPSERAILQVIPAEQITAMAAQMPPPPKPRRDFLRKTAATAVVLLGGAALSDCDSCQSQSVSGGAGEAPPERPEHREMESEGGAAPKEPPPRRVEEREMAKIGGAAPDEPEPKRAEDRPTTTRGGAAPDEPQPKRAEDRPSTTKGGAAPDEPPERPDRVPSPPGGARPDLPPPRPDDGDFADPPPGWDGGPPDANEEEPPPRPTRPSPTRGIRPRQDPPPKRPRRSRPTKGSRPDLDED